MRYKIIEDADTHAKYYLPKDLLEDVEYATGGEYDYFDSKNDVCDLYENALLDLHKLFMTYQMNLQDMLKDTDKYKMDKATREFIQELLDYKLYKSK